MSSDEVLEDILKTPIYLDRKWIRNGDSDFMISLPKVYVSPVKIVLEEDG